MANTYQFSKITTALNEYLDGSNLTIDLKKFFTSKTYTSVEKINAIDEDSSTLSLDKDEFDKQQGKIENILKYVAANEELFEKSDIEHILSQVVYFLISNDKKLHLDTDTANKLSKYELVKAKRRKKYVFWKNLGKKVLLPATITGILTAIGGTIISGARAIIGAGELISTVPALEIAGIATFGFSIGFLATVGIIVTKNIATRAHYHNKYGIKSHNFSELNKSDISTVEDLKTLNLPIIQLLDKIADTDVQLRELSIEGTQFWKHPINSLKSYFLTKINRNRMHEVVCFTKLLSLRVTESTPEDIKKKYELLLNTIDQYKDQIMKDRVGSMIKVREGQNQQNTYNINRTQVFEYSDIIAKEQLSREHTKATSGLVSRRAYEIINRKVNESLTGGDEYVRDLEAEAEERAARRAITRTKTSTRKAILIQGEREILDALENNDIETFVTGTGLTKETIVKITEMLSAKLKTTTGKLKKNPSTLISSKLLKDEEASVREAYEKLANFVRANSDLLTSTVS